MNKTTDLLDSNSASQFYIVNKLNDMIQKSNNTNKKRNEKDGSQEYKNRKISTQKQK